MTSYDPDLVPRARERLGLPASIPTVEDFRDSRAFRLHVERLLADAPPLTGEQINKLAVLLRRPRLSRRAANS